MTGPVDGSAPAIDPDVYHEQRLAALIGQDMACVLEFGLDARVLRVNDQLCHLTGFAREALLGHHLAECVPPEDWPAIRHALDALPTGDTPLAIEIRLNCRDSGLVWASGVFRLVRSNEGPPAGFIVLLLDISASRSMRERLILAEERLRLALDGARMGVWFWDLAGDTLDCSHVGLAFLGLPPGARPRFDDVLALVDADDRERVGGAFRSALASLEPLDIEFRVRLPDGAERWLSVMARASLDVAGQHGGMQGLVGDITHRKSQELLLARSLADNVAHTRQVELLNATLAQRTVDADTATRAREALLRNVSHEFRTPLNHISGAMDILLAGELAPAQRRWVVTAREAAEALAHIIDGVMEVARLAAGDVRTEQRDFAPATVLSEVAAMLSRRAMARELKVLVDVVADVPQWVSGDGAHVAQALLNYFDNAIKFTPSGSVTLAVLRATPPGPELRLRFEVRDTGIGIRKDVAERLFKPFVQGDDSVTRSYGGLGIGLSNARELAELMGGTAGVESRSGGGSTFWLEVPVQPATIDLLLVPASDAVVEQRVSLAPMTVRDLAIASDSLPVLRAQLLADDMRALASLRAVAPALRTLAGERDVERLSREVEAFDFPAALLTLGRIESHMAVA